MQQIAAEIIADSIGSHGIRITTVMVTMPRFVQAELNTHRMLSKNAASSRAIPTARVIEQVRNDPFVPKVFTKNQKGMMANEPLSELDQAVARERWRRAAAEATHSAESLVQLGVAKQYASRLLEPFMWTKVLLTGTEWKNFFALRIHEAAQPEMREVAESIKAAMDASTPVDRSPESGNLCWHIPFIDRDAMLECATEAVKQYPKEGELAAHATVTLALKRSVARCARVSYNNFEGKPSTVEQDLQLFVKLVGAKPGHWSPAEHQARYLEVPERSGNLIGWEQYRKIMPGENIPG
jgi:thymidylate synthase ThyX